MLQDALQQIREAEQQAEELVAKGRREAVAIREEAAHEVEKLEEQARRDRAEARAARIAEAEQRGRDRAERILSEGRKATRALVEQAEARMGTAIPELAEKLVG